MSVAFRGEPVKSKPVGGKVPCTNTAKCTSSHGKQFYSNGSAFCFVCRTYFHPNQDDAFRMELFEDLQALPEHYQPMQIRGISQATCDYYGYYIGYHRNQLAHAAVYQTPQGQVCAQKFRLPPGADGKKVMAWVGDSKRIALFGQWLWTPNPNISVVVTEGELDALSIAEIQQCKWPVVSIPNGIQSAHTDLTKHLEWLTGWKHVVLCFDNDEHAEAALDKCIPLFEPGKVKVVKLPLKDANEMLLAGRHDELQRAIMRAPIYRPDYIVRSSEISVEELDEEPPAAYSLPYPELELMIRGIQKGRIFLLYSGPGMGKSTIAREMAHHLVIHHGLKVGNIFLEEDLKETKQRYQALHNSISYADMCYEKQLIITDTMDAETKRYREERNASIREHHQNNWQRKKLTPEQLKATHAALFKADRLIFYKHEGCRTLDSILSRINYMAVGEKCDFIVLDNLSALISGLKDKQDDRTAIDSFMSDLDSIKLRTGVGIIVVNQAVDKPGNAKSYNEGQTIAANASKGSSTPIATADDAFTLEGNQQDEDLKRVRYLRNVKGRVDGDTGIADKLEYNPATGRYKPVLKWLKKLASNPPLPTPQTAVTFE